MNSAQVFRRILLYTLIISGLILVLGGGIGTLVAGLPGLISAAIGVGITVALSAITIASIAIASSGSVNMFFATVLGAWLLKAIVFITILALLRGQPFIDGPILFVSIVAAVVGTLIVDVVVVLKSRLPYIDDTASRVDLPGR